MVQVLIPIWLIGWLAVIVLAAYHGGPWRDDEMPPAFVMLFFGWAWPLIVAVACLGRIFEAMAQPPDQPNGAE